MQTKYKVLILSGVAILLGLSCFLIWWFNFRLHRNNYVVEPPKQEHINQIITDKHIDEGITTSIKIPKVVYLTYHDIDSIPSSVLDNFEKFCKGYRIEIHGDQSCEDFLYEYYGSDAMQLFRQMKVGPHKADFWRYCILYAKGGYYFDIQTNLKDHVDNIFKPTNDKEWFSVICSSNYPDCIYNGIIVTPPKNPILWDALINFYKNMNVSYLAHDHYLFRLIKDECVHLPRNGKNPLQNGWQCTLLKEKCTDCKAGAQCSKFDLRDCSIFNGNRQIANLEPNFPWAKEYVSSPNSLLIIDGGKRQYTKIKSSIAIAGTFSYHYECVGFLLDILRENYRVHVYHNDVEGFIDLFSSTYEFKSIKLSTSSIDGAFYDRVIILSNNDPIIVKNGKLTTSILHLKDKMINLSHNEMIKLSPFVGGDARYILPIYRPSLKSVDKRLHRIVAIGDLGDLHCNTRKLLRHVAKHTTLDIIHFSRVDNFVHKRIQNIVGSQANELEKAMIESRFAFVTNHRDRFSGIIAFALSCKTPMLMDSFMHDRYKIPALVYNYKKPKELISILKDMDDNKFKNLHEKVINFSEQLLKKNRTICSPFVKGSFTFTEIKNRTGQVKWEGNIPQSLFQTHERRTVPKNMAKEMKSVMESAPGASYTFYDAEERRKYIEAHYPSAIKPYDSLLPGAYKCDIFRYIRLYVEGGVYLDSPYSVSPKRTMFGDIINKNDDFVAAWDIRERKSKAVFYGFIASIPKHPILHELIETALRHVRQQDYLDTALSITGAVMMGRVMKRNNASTKKGVWLLDHEDNVISDEKGMILYTRYPEYVTDRFVLENGMPHYGNLWDSEDVYKKAAPSTSQIRKHTPD